ADALPDLRARHLADLEAERDILLDRHMLERRVVLEDEPDAALLRAAAGHLLLGDVDRARVGALEAGDAAQQRRLAGPRRAEQRDERAALDVERDVVERDEVTEALRDVADDDAHPRSGAGQAGTSAPCSPPSSLRLMRSPSGGRGSSARAWRSRAGPGRVRRCTRRRCR